MEDNSSVENESSDLTRDLRMLQNGILCDCCFMVGTGTEQTLIKAHKMVLALASPVFESMFFGDIGQQVLPVPILDVGPESFKKLLQHIYSKDAKLSTFDEAFELYLDSKKFTVVNVVTACVECMGKVMDSTNACRTLELGIIMKDIELQKISLKFIQKNTEAILNNSAFGKIQLATVLVIFEQQKLNVNSEGSLYMALHRWAMKECLRQNLEISSINLRKLVGLAPEKIRFLTMTLNNFNDSTLIPHLLTMDEITSIVMNLGCSKNANIPLIVDFSSVTDVRTKRPMSEIASIRQINQNESTEVITSTSSFNVQQTICVVGVWLPKRHDIVNIEIHQDAKTLCTANVKGFVSGRREIPLNLPEICLNSSCQYSLQVRECYGTKKKRVEHSRITLLKKKRIVFDSNPKENMFYSRSNLKYASSSMKYKI